MDSVATDTSKLIRKLSRRQWAVSLAVVILALGSLFLGWRGITNDQQTAEIINLAGRQRMLSQRMAMYLVLDQRETDQERKREYRNQASSAANDFDQAHARLVATARTLGTDSPIHSMYFGPTGSLDAESRRYLSLVRADIEASALGTTSANRKTATIVASAGDTLIKELHQVTALYQLDAERRVGLLLRLLQTSTLLVVGLVALGMFRVFRPVIRRLGEDVIARDQAQRELKDSEERFKAFSESSSDWFWETDTQHRFRSIKSGNNVPTPFPLEHMLGKTRLELSPQVEMAATEKWRAYQANMDARRPFRDFEYQAGANEQSLNWISVSGQPYFDSNGSFLGYRGTSRLIQTRKDIEASNLRLRAAIEQSPVSIVITNRDGLIEYVNPRFTKVTGYSAEEALGQNPRILQSGETPLSVYQELWQTLLAGREWCGVVRNRRKNGELFWEEASISPILDDKGQITHYLAVKEDITERKQIEDELEQHRAHLEDLVEQRTADLSSALEAAKVADQAKDAFLANVSHELRTPLNAVIGLSELARRISTDPRQQNYLDKVTGAGKTLASIINDLLDLSKISAGHMEFEAIAFSLRSLLERCNSVMAHRATEKGLELISRIDAAVPDVLRGDPLRIEQILMNLLSNAIKFTPAGRVELRIGLHARSETRICLNIEIEDTGIGLSEESIARLFQPFAQADASMNRKFGGTGLGLALCKRLAEMMNGEISATSREGAGATFQVRIWLEPGDAADLSDVTQGAGMAALPTNYRKVQVLVVDDQPLNREIVEALLAEVGIIPRIACNGREALNILKASGPQAFDLVLMDIQMPVMDGLTATREVRTWPGFGELPVIAMTAHTMEHEKEVSIAAGMNDHIGKPFETNHFFQLLARWIPVAKHQMPIDARAAIPPPREVGLAALHNIDTQAGLARFVGNETRYRHWLMEFLADAPEYATKIRQTLATGNQEAARQTAHAIKGRVGMLGMTGLHPIATALEAALMQGAPTDALLGQLQVTVELLCTEIRAAFGSTEPVAAPPPVGDQPPTGPIPESLEQLIVMIKCADGDSAEAIERCLSELKDTDWVPRLQQALSCVRNFDFDAAGKLLGPESPKQNGISRA
jgi:PAS domain S-box-containing protein